MSMNKGKPVPGGNFSNTNYFQSGRQTQGSNSSGNRSNNSRSYNNNSNNNNNNNNKGSSDSNRSRNGTANTNNSNSNGNRLKSRSRNDTKSSTKFTKSSNTESSNGYNVNSNRNHRNHNNTNNNDGANGGSRLKKITASNGSTIRRKNNDFTSRPRSFSNSNNNKQITSLPSRPASQGNDTQSDSNNFEVRFFGSLLSKPDTMGFQKLPHRQIKTPRYLLKENVLFDMSTFQQNQWDLENQEKLLKRESEYNGEPQLLFEEFQEYRKTEREMMEKLNLVDKENAKKSLDDAIIFRGSCQDMCPTYERVERVYKNQVSKWEKDPQTGKISRHLALKTFMRPSGQAPPLPSDVRPPNILQKSLNHIIENLLPKLPESQSFIWDRTRSIRQDFTFQNNYSGIESIDCHEKICRIHILSLHVMAGANDPDYQQQQEVEQFNNSLQTLTHMYDDVRSRGGYCPNEPEFRAYELISKLKDSELDRYLQTLPAFIQNDPIVERTIMLRNLIVHGMNSLNNYLEFFKAVLDKSKTPFLLASLTEIHFNEIRYNALRAMGRLYHSKSKKRPAVSDVTLLLAYNNEQQFLETCKLYQLPVSDDEGVMRVDVTALKAAFKFSQKQAYTDKINYMIGGRSMSSIVNSGKPNQDLNLKQPQSLEQIARESFKSGKKNSQKVSKIFSNNTELEFHEPVIKQDKFELANNPSNLPSLNNDNLFTAAPPPSQENTFSNSFNLSSNNKPADFGANINGTSTVDSTKTFNFASNSVNTPTFQNNSAGNSLQLQQNHLQEPIVNRETTLLKNNNASLPFPSLGNNAVPNDTKNNEFNVNNASFDTPSKTQPVPVIEEKVVPVKKLVDNPDFKRAAEEVANKVIHEFVSQKLEKMVKEKINFTRNKRRHNKKVELVKNLSSELFEAFMKEQIYYGILEGSAKSVYEKQLKQKMIRKLLKKSREILKKKQQIEATNNEIKSFNDSVVVPVVYPQISINQGGNTKPPMPVFPNMEASLRTIFNTLDSQNDLNGTIVLRSSKSLCSEWLLSQLGLNKDKTEINLKSDKGLNLHLSVLPDDFEPSDYFNNISTVIVQVGTVEAIDDPKKSTLLKCLKRDSKVLFKLKEYLESYSSAPCFSIIVVYVDAYKVGLSYNEIKNILKLGELSTARITIGFFKSNSSMLKYQSGLSVMRKVHLNFYKVLATVWKKEFTKWNKTTDMANNTESIIKNNNTTIASTFNTTTEGITSLPPSELIKKRMKYLHNVIDDATIKRRKFFNPQRHLDLHSYVANTSSATANYSNVPDDITNNSIVGNSTSMFKNSIELSNVKGFNNSLMVLQKQRNYDGKEETDIKDEKRIQELNELDRLADSILKN